LNYINEHPNIEQLRCDILPFHEVSEAELDEMWSFVFSKMNQRWLWLAIDHSNGQILAYTFGRRKDEVFRSFKELLAPFCISIYYTDDWGSYQRNLPAPSHVIGKKNTQTIERKNLTLRTRIKRLCRKTICYSKSEFMHDTVIGLVINIIEFGFLFNGFYRCRT
jgi:insertion element IS1 protein InsB